MKIFVLVAAAAMALASCQKPEIENVQPQEYEYTFLIGNADTKATVGETCVEWELGDKVGTYNSKSNNKFSSVTALTPATLSVYAPSNGNSAGLEENEVMYFYYPYASGTEVQKTSVAMSIPAVQDGDDDMPMVSLPVTVTSATTEEQNEYAGEIKFANLGSVIEFNVYTVTDAYASEVVKSVTFEADQALAGAFTFDLTSVDYSDESTLTIADYTETTVVVNAASDLEVGTKEDPAIVRMVVAPGTYAGSIIVKTDAATYTFPISSAKEFKRSAIKPLGLKLREDVREETKTVTFDFTSTSELQNWGIDLPNASAGTNISSMTLVKEEVSMTSTDGSTATRIWNSSGSYDLRVYKNATMTFTVPTGCVITELTMSGAATSGISVSLPPANPVVLTVGSEASTQKVSTITVSYREGVAPEPEAKTLKDITISGQTTTYTVGDTFEFDGTVTATYSDNTTATVEPTSVSSPAMDAAGTFDVTVTYTEGEVTVTASYNITVSAPVVDDSDYSGQYAIVAYRNSESLYYYLTNEETSTSTVRLTAVSAGVNKPEDNVVVAASKLWNVSKSGSVYTIQSVASEEYVSWTSGNSAVMSETGLQFTVTKQDDGSFNFVYGDRYLSLNGTQGNDYFAMYAGTQAQDLYLIKAVEGEEAKPTLTEISVSPKTTTYTVGDTFVFDGTVTATYSNGTTATVTPTSVLSPAMDAAGTFDVTVKYTEGEVTVEAIYKITINEKPAEGESVTVEMSTFTDTSADMNAVISYTTAKGGGTANPAINGGEIRLYQNSAGTGGGTITITAKDGYKLSSVTIGSSMATKVAYTIGTSTTKSTSASVSANGKYTVDDINATSITFYCMGTSSSSRLYVNYLSATYVAD